MTLTPSTPASQRYTVILRDEEFTLRKGQLEFDAPNYFTAFFFGDFKESSSGSPILALDRNPDLFAIVVEYMCGYTILPLAAKALPRMMDERLALQCLAEDAAFYGLTRLHAMLTKPRIPRFDLSWTGFSGRVITFEDVLNRNFPAGVSYTTAGLCSFDGNSGKPVLIYARDIPLRLVGNLELDKTGRPPLGHQTVTYRLDLTPDQKARLKTQPHSGFTYDDNDPRSLIVSVYPESLLHINERCSPSSSSSSQPQTRCRFEHFAQWWRGRRVFAYAGPASAYAYGHEELNVDAMRVFDEAFPLPFEDPIRREEGDRNEFVLFADELLFVITARGFLARTLQCHVKLLDVRARTRAAVFDSMRPLALPKWD